MLKKAEHFSAVAADWRMDDAGAGIDAENYPMTTWFLDLQKAAFEVCNIADDVVWLHTQERQMRACNLLQDCLPEAEPYDRIDAAMVAACFIASPQNVRRALTENKFMDFFTREIIEIAEYNRSGTWPDIYPETLARAQISLRIADDEDSTARECFAQWSGEALAKFKTRILGRAHSEAMQFINSHAPALDRAHERSTQALINSVERAIFRPRLPSVGGMVN